MSEDFDYSGFASTTGLSLNDGAVVSGDEIVLGDIGTLYDTRGVFRTEQDYFDDDWTMFFRVYIEDDNTTLYGLPADGYAIVWAQSSTYINAYGGAVGYFNADGSTGGTAANTRGLAFRHFGYQDIIYSVEGATTNQYVIYGQVGDFRNWLEYDATGKTLTLYRDESDTKPSSPTLTITDVDFGSGPYNLGITSATGAGSMNCRLKAWSLEGASGTGWGMLL